MLCFAPGYLFAETSTITASFESELEARIWESELGSKRLPENLSQAQLVKQIRLAEEAPLPTDSVTEATWENEERDIVSEIITLQKQVQSDFHKEMAGLEPYSFHPGSDSKHTPYFSLSKVVLISGPSSFNLSFVRITNTRESFDSENQTVGFRPICPNLSIPDRILQFLAIKLNSPPPGFPKQQILT
ncbi:hypothetical protein [Leptospira ilyithenensis]|uniref:Uncharacterized protein n=1 Tax=Leptospira ilyithenensis TaxID=2484901 RepID=A0A4R9LUT9_9LEPT|nr:hypothetical protein [Leptospira ilyithenensis]TGN14346.1 hypothetical protein EHS11_02415 [Leptospira ilyithenensis]